MKNRRKATAVLLAMAILVTACSAGARTWYVKPDSTGDTPTIQAAIDSAAAGDEVVLTNGVFTGDGNRDIDTGGKAVVIRSEGGDPDSCVIDCQANSLDRHRGFNFSNGEGPATRLEGVMIKNGWQHGAAVRIRYASPAIVGCKMCGGKGGTGGALNISGGSEATFEDCEFFSNTADDGGAAAIGGEVRPVFTSCYFHNNTANVEGGGIRAGDASFVLDDCIFTDNHAYDGGAIHLDLCASDLLITGCTIAHNSAHIGPGIYNSRGSPTFEYCTFVYNGGPHVFYFGRELQLVNCILAYSATGPAIYCNISDPGPTLTCCDIYGNADGDWVGCYATQLGINGNFSACPSFCWADMGDYRLCDESPCAPGNHPDGYDCGLIGAWEVGCACGPTRAEPTTWGRVKAMYR